MHKKIETKGRKSMENRWATYRALNALRKWKMRARATVKTKIIRHFCFYFVARIFRFAK